MMLNRALEEKLHATSYRARWKERLRRHRSRWERMGLSIDKERLKKCRVIKGSLEVSDLLFDLLAQRRAAAGVLGQKLPLHAALVLEQQLFASGIAEVNAALLRLEVFASEDLVVKKVKRKRSSVRASTSTGRNGSIRSSASDHRPFSVLCRRPSAGSSPCA